MYKRVYLNKEATEATITRHNESGDLLTLRTYNLRDLNAQRVFDAVNLLVVHVVHHGTVYDTRHKRCK